MKAPLFRAWVRYLLAYLAVAVPVRGLAVLLSDSPGRVSEVRDLLLVGLVLLPVSFLCFRWSVGQLLRASPGAEG